MQLGVCAAVYGDLELAAAVAPIAAAGFQVIDLPTDSTSRLLAPLGRLEDAEYQRAVGETLRAHGLSAGCVSNSRDTQLLLGPHGPHTDGVLRGDAAAKQAHALRYAYATIELACRIGAPQVRLYFGCPDFARWLRWPGSPVSWEDNLHAFAEAAAPLLGACRARGLHLCVEPHPKQVIYSPSTARRAVELLRDHAGTFRLCVDPANLATLGYEASETLRGWGPWLGAVHAKDVQVWRRAGEPTGPGWVPYGPQPMIRFRAVGSGELRWPALVSTLVEEGFDGVLYVEHEDLTLAREDGLRQARDILRPLLPAHPAPSERTW
jgi:sugar phosphate isomerase/epimerase